MRAAGPFKVAGAEYAAAARRSAATVIDYKYSQPDKLAPLLRAHKEGRLVQGGLYALAARRVWKREVAAVLYGAVRNDVAWKGWREPEAIEEIVEIAVAKTLEAAGGIRAGRIRPEPADVTKCAYCDYRDICRVETAAVAAVRTGGAGA